MGFYARHVLPPLLDLVMRDRSLAEDRRKYVAGAGGRVLEIGIGSGLNLAFYSGAVSGVVGVDPSLELQRMARKRARGAPFGVEFVAVSGEAIPVEDASFDTVVTTWTLCSIARPALALAEMRRALKPSGRLIFVEHGQSPEARVARWQRRINPLWRRIAGGCNLDRPMDEMIVAAGFALEALDASYGRGPKTLAFLYRGTARPR